MGDQAETLIIFCCDLIFLAYPGPKMNTGHELGIRTGRDEGTDFMKKQISACTCHLPPLHS